MKRNTYYDCLVNTTSCAIALIEEKGGTERTAFVFVSSHRQTVACKCMKQPTNHMHLPKK